MSFVYKYGLYVLLMLSILGYAFIARNTFYLASNPIFILITLYVILYTFLFSKIHNLFNIILLLIGLALVGIGAFLMMVFQGFDISDRIGIVGPFYYGYAVLQLAMLIGSRIRNH